MSDADMARLQQERIEFVRDRDALTASLREACAALESTKPAVEHYMKAAVKENFGYVGNDKWANQACDIRDTVGITLANIQARHPDLGETKDE